MNLDVVNGALAGAKIFGQNVHMGRQSVDLDKLVLGFESGFAGFLYVVGTFLAIFATAHLVPRLQEKGTVDLYLSRPVGRVPLLLSRYAGGTAPLGLERRLPPRRDVAPRHLEDASRAPALLPRGGNHPLRDRGAHGVRVPRSGRSRPRRPSRSWRRSRCSSSRSSWRTSTTASRPLCPPNGRWASSRRSTGSSRRPRSSAAPSWASSSATTAAPRASRAPSPSHPSSHRPLRPRLARARVPPLPEKGLLTMKRTLLARSPSRSPPPRASRPPPARRRRARARPGRRGVRRRHPRRGPADEPARGAALLRHGHS